MNWLREPQLVPRYEAKAKDLLKDPWAGAGSVYINSFMTESPENVTKFLGEARGSPA